MCSLSEIEHSTIWDGGDPVQRGRFAALLAEPTSAVGK